MTFFWFNQQGGRLMFYRDHAYGITLDVASVAKQFTELSVTMLIQQGKLALDDDIHKHLPDLPDFGKPITINHLLHHTSGLRDWPARTGSTRW